MKKNMVVMVAVALACLLAVGFGASGLGASNSASSETTSDQSSEALVESTEDGDTADSASSASPSDQAATTPDESAEDDNSADPAPKDPVDDIVEVPDFTDRYVATAAARAFELGLVPVCKSDNGEMVINPFNWRVIDQDPFPGETVEMNTVVILKVTKDSDSAEGSGGADSIAVVPSLVGMSADDAEKLLDEVGLEAVIESDSGKKVLVKSNWTVVSQQPDGGTAVEKGAEVLLTVSKDN